MADEITCPMCGERYDEAAGRACRPECPLAATCSLVHCPRCGYEMPAPSRLTRWLSRWLGV